MIGAKYYIDKDRYHSQENNPTEAYNKARLASRAKYWLETCGPTSAVNCMAVMGYDLTIWCPGNYHPQPEEVLMDYFNDPRNSEKLKEIRDLGENVGIPENQVPQYYPIAVKNVFNVDASFIWGHHIETVKSHLQKGRAIQICLKNPGHFVAIVAYDESKHRFVINDSWGARFADGKGGFNRTLALDEFEQNTQPYMIVYGCSI